MPEGGCEGWYERRSVGFGLEERGVGGSRAVKEIPFR